MIRRLSFHHKYNIHLFQLYHGCHKVAKIQRRVFVDEECVNTELKEQVLTILVKAGTPAGTQITFTEAGDMGHAIVPGESSPYPGSHL